MNFCILGDLDINLFDEGEYNMNNPQKNVCADSDLPCNHDDDVHLIQTYEAYEASMKHEEHEEHEVRQMWEINRNSRDNINNQKCLEKCDIDIIAEEEEEEEAEMDAIFIDDTYAGSCGANVCNDIYVNLRPIELLINTTTVEEVIFKKYIVEILDKHTRSCVMEGVVVGYDIVGQSYDPDIVLKFQDGRTFYNENFGYLLRFYI